MKQLFVYPATLCFLAAVSGGIVSSRVNAQNNEIEPELSTAIAAKSQIIFVAKVPSRTAIGSRVRLSAAIRNRSEEATQIITSHANALRMKIIDSAGQEVPRTRYGRTVYRSDVYFGHFATKPVLAGETIEEVVELDRVFDLSLPGTYSLSLSKMVCAQGELIRLEIPKISFGMSDMTP